MPGLRLFFAAGLLAAMAWPAAIAGAAAASPAASVETIRTTLFDAQLALAADRDAASVAVRSASSVYEAQVAAVLAASAPDASRRARNGFELLAASAGRGDGPGFAAARAQVWTAILDGSYTTIENALRHGDGATAQAWLLVREFRAVTRFSRPNADATLAVDGFVKGSLSRDDALLALQADWLDTYQARLTKALHDLSAADAGGFAIRRSELAALAQGYFLILAPAYGGQRGAPALAEAQAAFASLRAAALAGENLATPLQRIDEALHNFRAAPLSPAEQSRRAGQLLRYLDLVPVEYGRGVAGGQVIRGLEIQEAATFQAGAYAAFADLENLLDARDRARTVQAEAQFESLGRQLADAAAGRAVPSPEAIQAQSQALAGLLRGTMPEAWLKGSAQGDFDVIASLLEQMDAAAQGGDYDLAESARLEAYAILETGPEARLMVFAPQLKLRLEDLFWNGPGPRPGLAGLIQRRAAPAEITATRAELAAVLAEARTALGASSAPAAVAANAGLIVFREGLEAVLILASLMSSFKRAAEYKYRRSMWLGGLAALAATAVTWLLAREVLQSLARYGERLEAVVSLIAIAILLLITNWFFHKTYWTGWIAGFHSRKRQLLTGEAGLWLGLAMLGFTSVYREGFETVLFLQALVLESGTAVVLSGVAAALLAVAGVGVVTFRLQINLPYKKMLIVTGILIAAVLLQMVGNTAHVLQVVGWLPIHVVESLLLPYWLGTWFGLYATWEGLALQAAAAAFVIGSYYLAEHLQARQLRPERAAA